MNGIAFEWDRRKDTANRRKHRVAFAEAITIPDPNDSVDEERLVIIGMSIERRLLVVVHTIRGERIRLIRARSATKHERRNYEEGSHEGPYQ